MRLLLISNSTNAGEAYLEYPKKDIRNFLGRTSLKALFIPYAGVTIPWDEYTALVKSRFMEIDHDIESIHTFSDPLNAVRTAEAIVVGGGNTFMLAAMLQKNNLMDIIREKVFSGIPFVGWSAGANIACPTICTTNDMPIIQPLSFNALHFVPFQINPHYTDAIVAGHAGESRQARIEEFIEVNQNIWVVGLREGSMLRLENDTFQLTGSREMALFRYGTPPQKINPADDIHFLLEEPQLLKGEE